MKHLLLITALLTSTPTPAQCFGYCGQPLNPLYQPQPPVQFTPLPPDPPPAQLQSQYPSLPQPQQDMLIRQFIQSGAPAWQVQWLIQNRGGK